MWVAPSSSLEGVFRGAPRSAPSNEFEDATLQTVDVLPTAEPNWAPLGIGRHRLEACATTPVEGWHGHPACVLALRNRERRRKTRAAGGSSAAFASDAATGYCGSARQAWSRRAGCGRAKLPLSRRSGALGTKRAAHRRRTAARQKPRPHKRLILKWALEKRHRRARPGGGERVWGEGSTLGGGGGRLRRGPARRP